MSRTEPAPTPMAEPAAWSRVVEGYTDVLVPLFERFATDALDAVALRAGERLADIAAGPGTLSLLAARRGAGVSALDFSEAMLATLERRAEAAGLSEHIESICADASALPWPDAHHDVVTSMFGVIFFSDRAGALSEMHRVLKPGGRVAIATWVPLDEVPIFRSTFAALIDALGGDPDEARPEQPLSDSESLRAELAAAGFVDIEVTHVTRTLTVPSVEAWWASMVRSSAPIAMVRASLEPGTWDEVSQEVVERLTDELGAERAIEAPMTALLGVARRAS